MNATVEGLEGPGGADMVPPLDAEAAAGAAAVEGGGAGSADPADPGAPSQTKLEWIESGVDKVATVIRVGVDTLNAVQSANSPFVGAAAVALLDALTSVATRVPYIGDCVKVLRDIFDLYQVGVLPCAITPAADHRNT